MNRPRCRTSNTKSVGAYVQRRAVSFLPYRFAAVINAVRFYRQVALLLAGLILTGCKTHLETAAYSPDYQALTRADGRVELIPVECLKPSAEDQFGTDEEDYVPLLPPGCANNLTLLQMVEQRSDLMQGRQSGPTMAAPVGRAAQVYIDGYDREELRRRQMEQEKKTDTQGAQ